MPQVFKSLRDIYEQNTDWYRYKDTCKKKKKSNMNNYNKTSQLGSEAGKSIWPTDHHLRGRAIVPAYPVWCRILLRGHKVAVRLLKEIALLMGHRLTQHITQGNTHLGGSGCLKKPDHQWPPSHQSGTVPPLSLMLHTNIHSQVTNWSTCLANFFVSQHSPN